MFTEQQRINLDKLATYLERLPEDYDHFSMRSYFRLKDGLSDYDRYYELRENYALRNGGVGPCGAVACAVGHGPSAGVLFKPEEMDGDYPLWSKYSNNFCPLTTDDSVNNSDAFEWLFGGEWAKYDNTPQGAAKRIRYALEHGVPPVRTKLEIAWANASYDEARTRVSEAYKSFMELYQ